MDRGEIDALIRTHALFLCTSGVRQAEIAKSLAIYTPDLIAEIRALQERVQELEKAMTKIVKIEVPLPECAVCWERDKCTDRAHGDNCLAIGYIIDTAMEAAKEAGK